MENLIYIVWCSDCKFLFHDELIDYGSCKLGIESPKITFFTNYKCIEYERNDNGKLNIL